MLVKTFKLWNSLGKVFKRKPKNQLHKHYFNMLLALLQICTSNATLDTNNVLIVDGKTVQNVEVNTYKDQTLEIKFTGSVETIGENAFNGFSKITKLVIPSNVKNINKNAFTQCINLVNVVLPDQINTIAAETFGLCESLEMIHLPKSLEFIEEKAFFFCSKLDKIILHENVKRIDKKAFYGCFNLKKVYF